jgi:hypothetical protein
MTVDPNAPPAETVEPPELCCQDFAEAGWGDDDEPMNVDLDAGQPTPADEDGAA